MTTTHLPNSVSLPSLKSALISAGQNGGGGLRHRGARGATAPVALQQRQQQETYLSGGHTSSCLYQFLYCILSDQVSPNTCVIALNVKLGQTTSLHNI